MEDYEKMLDAAYAKIPEKVRTKERWEAPDVLVVQQGSQTAIKNINEIKDYIRREPQHILKFISRELATAGNYDGKRLLLQGRFTQQQLSTRMKAYIREYVLCSECAKPDTSLISFEGSPYKRCEVCGAKAPVKKI